MITPCSMLDVVLTYSQLQREGSQPSEQADSIGGLFEHEAQSRHGH